MNMNQAQHNTPTNRCRHCWAERYAQQAAALIERCADLRAQREHIGAGDCDRDAAALIRMSQRADLAGASKCVCSGEGW